MVMTRYVIPEILMSLVHRTVSRISQLRKLVGDTHVLHSSVFCIAKSSEMVLRA